jgi:hypothetical protein
MTAEINEPSHSGWSPYRFQAAVFAGVCGAVTIAIILIRHDDSAWRSRWFWIVVGASGLFGFFVGAFVRGRHNYRDAA